MMRKAIILFLCLTSVCFGDTFSSHLKPNANNTLDVGTSLLQWRHIYGVDGTFSGTVTAETFDTIAANITTTGTITAGSFVGTWNGDEIDISDYTNLAVQTPVLLMGDTIWLDTPLEVQYGGTEAITLTDGGLLVGSGTSAITALAVASNGQIPIGDGATDPVLATLTEGLAIDITNGAGSITLDFDPTEFLGSRTWGDGSTDTIIWTWDRATGIDPTITFGNDLVTFSGSLTAAAGIFDNITIDGSGITQDASTATDFTVTNADQDKDIIFYVNDGGSSVDVLTLKGASDSLQGDTCTASGDKSFAWGSLAVASGDTSLCVGSPIGKGAARASGDFSIVLGAFAQALDNSCIAIGASTEASSVSDTTITSSVAIGYDATASHDFALAFGVQTTASGEGSGAIGFGATASGGGATALGKDSTASGTGSLAISNVTASNTLSIAMGDDFTNNLASTIGMGFGAMDFTLDANDLTWDGDATISGHLGLGGASVSDDHGLFYEEVLTDTDNSVKAGLHSNLQVAKTAAAMTSSGRSGSFACILDSTNTQNWTNTIGLQAIIGNAETESGSTGTVTGATAFTSFLTIADAATVTNGYGLYVNTPTVAGAKLVNDYGIYIADQSAGSGLNYALYTNAGLVNFGGATDYVEIEEDGTIELNGTATVFDDIRTPMTAIRITGPGGTTPPDEELYKGSVVLAFGGAGSDDEKAFFTVQIPHWYKEGTNIVPHIHWTPEDNTAGNVRWIFTYSWANIDAAFPAESTDIIEVAADETTDKHQRDNFSAMIGTGKTISSMILCSIQREDSDPNDTFNGKDSYLLEFDFHAEKDTMGSRSINDAK